MSSEKQKEKALNNLAMILNPSGTKGQLSAPNSKNPSSRPISSRPPLAKQKIETDETYLGVNQVLVYSLDKKSPPTYYVPCYIRMKVNRVSDINYIDGQASIESDIRLWVMLKEFPEVVQKEIMSLARIEINNKDCILFE